MQGTIKKLTDKNFGFIASNDSDKDLFFHASQCAAGCDFNGLREGEEVTFDVTETEKGPAAVNVQKV